MEKSLVERVDCCEDFVKVLLVTHDFVVFFFFLLILHIIYFYSIRFIKEKLFLKTKYFVSKMIKLVINLIRN